MRPILQGACTAPQLPNHHATFRDYARRRLSVSNDRFRGEFLGEEFFQVFQQRLELSGSKQVRQEAAYARSRGYVTVLGTMFAFDTRVQNQAMLKFLLKWLAVPGGILVMHDGDLRAATTATVLDQIIPDLRRLGFEFRSLDELDTPKQSK